MQTLRRLVVEGDHFESKQPHTM